VSAGGEPDPAAFLGLPAGARVLDAAGGRGRAAASLAGAGMRVVLLDRSARALEGIDPDLRSRVAAVRGDACALPFPEGTFEGVVLRAVVHHLVEPGRALREAGRVLRPGGAVVVVDRTAPADRAAGALRNAVDRIRHSGHVWAWTPKELRALARSAWLDVEAAEEWTEERDAASWIAGGTCGPPWDGIVMEYLRADAAAGGPAFGAEAVPGGGLLLRERWTALRLRRSGKGK